MSRTYGRVESHLLAQTWYATTAQNSAIGRSSPLHPHRTLISGEYGPCLDKYMLFFHDVRVPQDVRE